MGVRFEKVLQFDHFLDILLKKMDTAFQKLVGATLSKQMPWLFSAACVPERVESVAFGLVFCINVSHAETALNRMQVCWAKTLLGVRDFQAGSWKSFPLSVGWGRRLGTMMFCAAILLEARVMALPPESILRKLLDIASTMQCASWAQQVKVIRSRIGGIPDFSTWMQNLALEDVPDDKLARKQLVADYKFSVVYPALTDYDSSFFGAWNDEWPFLNFDSAPCPTPTALLQNYFSSHDWHDLRIWYLVRASGRWPLPLCHINQFPRVLDECPLCRTGTIHPALADKSEGGWD